MSDLERVNGNQISWGSAILKLDGDRFTGITEVSFSDKRERVKAYGMGRHHAPRGRSAGKYTVDNVKIVGWKSSLQIFREQLAARSPDGISYGNIEFELIMEYVELDETPLIVNIERCVWAASNTSDTEGPENLKEDAEFDPMLIRRNGLVLFDSSEGGP